MLDPAALAQINILQEHLEYSLHVDNEEALKIALLLLDLYETILEQQDMLVVYRGEEIH